VPWSPTYDDAEPDPRLDPYRDRAARLMDGGSVAGYVLVETDYRAELEGGALWGRRWARPVELAIVLTKLGDAEPRTAGVDPADFDLFDRWARAGYDDNGRILQVVWLDETESARVHDEVFAHQH
jgi:hypothetical protein